MGVFDKFSEYINAALDARINDLKKGEPFAQVEAQAGTDSFGETLMKAMKPDGIGRKGLLFDPFYEQGVFAGGLYRGKTSFMPNHLLKQVSRKDAIVASIIDVRASQVSSACKKQNTRFDLGFKIKPKDNSVQIDDEEIRKIEEFILNCGRAEDRAAEDRMTFDQWGYMVAADFMRYGHTAIELVKTNDTSLYAFLPLSAETIYYANKKIDKTLIQGMRDIWKQVAQEGSEVDLDKAAAGEYEYIQMINGKVVEGFTKDELIFERINLESDIDLNGYAVGPLERAIAAVTSHLQIENHQKAFFTHGAASKGVLVIQGDVAPNTLKALQAQWTQQITGPLNAWRTPILAGIEGVQWVPLVSSNRDMEYAAYQDHILRTLFSCFAMDPEEAGFGYLSKGTEQRSLSESSNEWKITASRDRGLRPVLGRIESIINERVLPELSKEYSEKYHFCFIGLDAETETEEVQRLSQEVALHTTVNEVRDQVERKPLPFGGDLILNPLLLQTLAANMTKGQFMEVFMGVQGASERPDLQYIPDPFWFQWQQLQVSMMQQQSGPQDQGGEEQSGYSDGQDGQGEEGQEGNTPQEVQGDAQDEAARQAASSAIDQYMAANPELFKAMRKNLEAQGIPLYKSTARPKRIQDKHVDKMRDDLVKDFRFASSRLLEEVMGALKDESEGKDDE